MPYLIEETSQRKHIWIQVAQRDELHQILVQGGSYVWSMVNETVFIKPRSELDSVGPTNKTYPINIRFCDIEKQPSKHIFIYLP